MQMLYENKRSAVEILRTTTFLATTTSRSRCLSFSFFFFFSVVVGGWGAILWLFAFGRFFVANIFLDGMCRLFINYLGIFFAAPSFRIWGDFTPLLCSVIVRSSIRIWGDFPPFHRSDVPPKKDDVPSFMSNSLSEMFIY